MEKTLEIEEMMELLEAINISLKENEINISNMKEEVSNITNEELKLKKIYPDLCILEQVTINIEMNKKNMQECDEEDKDTIAAFSQMIESLENQRTSILRKLEGSDVLDKKDYEIKMETIKEQKSKIQEIELQIEQKEKECFELKQKKDELENKIRELQDYDGVSEEVNFENESQQAKPEEISDEVPGEEETLGEELDEMLGEKEISDEMSGEEETLGEESKEEATKNEEFNVVEEFGVNQVNLGEAPHEELERRKREAIRVEHEIRQDKDITKRDLTKTKTTGKTSELASFIGYEEEAIEEKKKIVVEEITPQKKEETVDEIVENLLKKLDGVVRKFEEIIDESNDGLLNKNVIYLKNKFGQKVYDYVYDVVNKFMNKRKEIQELENKLDSPNQSDEEERLTKLNENLVTDIDKIKELEQKFTGDVISSYNSFRTFVQEESDSLAKLNKNLKDQVDLAYSKLSDIEEKLKILKENSKESILESIREFDKKIALVDKEERDLRGETKEKVVELLNGFVENIKSSDYCEDLIDIMGELKQQLDNEQGELSNKKVNIDEKRNGLESERKELEAKYKVKKENDTDKKEEMALANLKEELKKEVVKMLETLNDVKIKHNKFERKSEEFKVDIKSDIKRKDMNIIKDKTKLLEIVNKEKKSPRVRLFESIKEYNDSYTMEFERYLKKAEEEIDDIAKENYEYKKDATNIVVISEFEENGELLRALKIMMEKSINKDKLIEYQDEIEYEVQSDIQKEIEENISKIRTEDSINSQIDFGEIYAMEDKVKEINDIKQSLYNLCLKLNMNEEVKNNELKLREQEKEQDEQVKAEIKNEEVSQNVEEEQNKVKEEATAKPYGVSVNKKKNNNMAGLEEYSDETREILLNMPWNQLVELKNMNKEYQRILYIEDLEQLKNEKVQNIAKLKEQYKKSVEYAKKLYEIKKYVLAYKKGMEELAKGAKKDDKTSQKEHSNFMKIATRSLKIMKENGISGFEDFRDKVIKNSDLVKEILNKTKSENESLVKLMGLIQSIKSAEEALKSGIK